MPPSLPYSFIWDKPRLVEVMSKAPSIFRQQPWTLEVVADNRAELFSDPKDELLGRLLPREVVISCGAALYNLRLAIRVAGREPSVWLFPRLNQDPRLLNRVTAGRTLLASVEVMPNRTARPTAAQQEMYEAIWLRRTDRWPYWNWPVPPPILMEMEHAAARERGWLRVLHGRQRRQVIRAVNRANKNPLLGMLNGLNEVAPSDYGPAPRGRWPATRPIFWLNDKFAGFENPQLMSLSTDDDRPLDWLRAGEALQHALLNGTRFSMSALGGRSTPYRQQLEYGPLDPHRHIRPHRPVPAGYAVEASFLTQVLELADLKAQLAALHGHLTAPARVDLNALELADLEGLELADRKNKQRQKDGGLRWPWHTYFTEIPQIVMRVGYAPAERAAEPGSSYTGPMPRPWDEPETAALQRFQEED